MFVYSIVAEGKFRSILNPNGFVYLFIFLNIIIYFKFLEIIPWRRIFDLFIAERIFLLNDYLKQQQNEYIYITIDILNNFCDDFSSISSNTDDLENDNYSVAVEFNEEYEYINTIIDKYISEDTTSTSIISNDVEDAIVNKGNNDHNKFE